jgi:hypothetical protein
LNCCSERNLLFEGLFCAERETNIVRFVENARRTDCVREKPNGDNRVKRELIDKLLEASRQAARDVESAVAAVKDPHLRGVIAGVIMQRILDEVDTNEKIATGTASAAYSGDSVKKSGTQARILDLQADNFFREPRRLEEVLEELRIRGYHHNKSDARMSLLRLARKKLLRRIALGEGRQRMYLYVSP